MKQSDFSLLGTAQPCDLKHAASESLAHLFLFKQVDLNIAWLNRIAVFSGPILGALLAANALNKVDYQCDSLIEDKLTPE